MASACYSEKKEQQKRSCVKCTKPAIKRCVRCRTVWYCGVECQTQDWLSCHKPICRAIEFQHLLSDKRSGLLEFLNRSDNGDHANLIDMFGRIETTTKDPLPVMRWSKHPTKKDSIYEWPTNELCSAICSILSYEKFNDTIVELGAGMGLLSARVNHLLKQKNQKAHMMATDSKYDYPLIKLKEHHYTSNLFGIGAVKEMSCGTFDEKVGTPVLMAWMSPQGLQEMDALIVSKKPAFFLAIGDFFPTRFYKEAAVNGVGEYSVTIVTPKMLCHKDRVGKPSHSHLLWYRLNKPSVSRDEMKTVFPASLIAECPMLYDDKIREQMLKDDYEFLIKHDPTSRFACANPHCGGVSSGCVHVKPLLS